MGGLIILSVMAIGSIGYIIYVFRDKGSSRLLKLASLGALILIGLAIVVCSIILIFFRPAEVQDPFTVPLMLPVDQPAEPETPSNLLQMIIFIIISLLILGFIVYIYMRQHKNHQADSNQKTSKPSSGASKTASAEFADDDFNFDDSFD